MIELLKKRLYIFIAVAIVLLIVIVYFVVGGGKDVPYDFVIAENGSVSQEVSVTGSIEPAEAVDLAFEGIGRVSGAHVKVGDRVFAGQLLVQQNNSELLAQLEGVKANLKIEEAELEELEKGTRPEEILVQEVKVQNAETALINTKQDLIDKIQDIYTKSDDAIRGKIDQFFSNPRGANPQLSFSPSSFNLEINIESDRVFVESRLISWQISLGGLDLDSDMSLFIKEAKDNSGSIKDFLENISLAVSDLSSTYDSWKTDVSTARMNVNTGVVNLSSAEEGMKTAISTLNLAKQNLELAISGSTPEQIATQKAHVEKAEADVRNYQAKVYKTLIRSPIGGVVTVQDAKVGEIVSANIVLVSVISDSNFEIEADVPEVDVAKIELGDEARVTLDAYGDDVIFSAIVVAIDPAETVIEGVPSYKTTFQFKEEDSRIRSGMTANIDILTDYKEGVIVIPQRAVITRNGFKIVRILEDGQIREVEVKTGLRGSFGNIEILEGISEGDKVVTFMRS
ncbi:efflux RND transporter periplasmic adaptor subunit [Patescibacteria group bacterium]